MRAVTLLLAGVLIVGALVLAAGVGYEIGHVRGYRAGVTFEARWRDQRSE